MRTHRDWCDRKGLERTTVLWDGKWRTSQISWVSGEPRQQECDLVTGLSFTLVGVSLLGRQSDKTLPGTDDSSVPVPQRPNSYRTGTPRVTSPSVSTVWCVRSPREGVTPQTREDFTFTGSFFLNLIHKSFKVNIIVTLCIPKILIFHFTYVRKYLFYRFDFSFGNFFQIYLPRYIHFFTVNRSLST